MSGTVIGIDFGTATATIAQAKRGGIETLNNEGSKRQTPQLVSFQGKQRFAGVTAEPMRASNYKNTVDLIKRWVGKSWSDPCVQHDLEFVANRSAFKELEGDKIGIEVHYQDELMILTPEVVCSMMIASLRNTAVFANEGRPVSDIVFSCPASWTDRQRRAFLASAKIADVPVLGLLNEGTAIALSYGIWKSAGNQFSADKPEHVMFVDMGYAHFTVTVVAYVQGKLTVVSSSCDNNLGGRDVDMALAKHLAKVFVEKHKKPDPFTQPKAFLKLMSAVEKCKQTLTPEGVPCANVHIEYLVEETDFSHVLQVEKFVEVIEPILARLQAPLEEAMELSGLTMADIGSVEISGGGTRVRAVKKKIAEILGLDTKLPNYGLATTQNADEAVAKGCALRCAMLSPVFRVKEFIVQDRVSVPINVSWEQSDAAVPNDAMESEEGVEEGLSSSSSNTIQLFEKGCELPKTRRIAFYRNAAFEVAATYAPEARALFSSEADMHIGTFRVSSSDFPQAGETPPRIRVDFKQDENGVFRVVKAELLKEIAETAEEGKAADGEKNDEAKLKEAQDDKPKKKKFRPLKCNVEAVFDGALSEAEILELREREIEWAAHDRLLVETANMKNKCETYVYSMRDKIDGDLQRFGKEEEFDSFRSLCAQTEDWLYNEGWDETKAVYEAKFKELEAAGGKFLYRQQEFEGRGEMVAKLEDEIAAALKVVNSPDEQYDHIEADERTRVRQACDDASAWLKTQLDKQADVPENKDPKLTIADIKQRIDKLSNICRPVLTKRRPAKKAEKKEEGKTAEAKKADPASEGSGADEPPPADDKDRKGDSEEANDMDID